MTHNDILRRLRYALNFKDSTMLEIFKLSEHEIERATLTELLKKEDEAGYVECSNKVLESFLDGLILYKRGRQEGPPKKSILQLSNNSILKKLRVALKFQEADMLGIFKLANMEVSKSELTALFRKEGHKKYQECGDQFLRNFLMGLTIRYRTDGSMPLSIAAGEHAG
ncbi:MAG: DUF1456 domain-containing protein [Gammaproteobacteria bacterium]|nr:MAG: DUF1456 domain-containing protein [Gammaproteobacteria bacterium]RKZ44759.1 MAG: DUF1456 domain-containing protein [Gammaproteobacteria bacterium]RKZ74996.1 MAG: DUF1456 domain-containing protein [Gammaproteobacteria bacterium]